ncbi:protein cereblon-like [Panonychus citri]|uniref:protein cereblon-like n=1 Tax=Panonychus citri TaxID=50023 RepID=UPI002307F3D1|nr:protein cereblon-like [Panonychus citri]
MDRYDNDTMDEVDVVAAETESESSFTTDEEDDGNNIENGVVQSLEDESIAGNEGNSRRSTGFDYDPNLPAQHSYLGNNLRELSGRVVLDDEALITLPLLSLTGVILIPGQILPLQLEHPSMIAMMLNAIEKERTFGILASNSDVGTTVEIRSYSREVEDDADENVLRIKAEGRQRFKLVEKWRQDDGFIMGKVRIMCDIELLHPFEKDLDFTSKGNRFNSKLVPALTVWPSFVYRMYDSHYIMHKINDQLRNWANISKPSPGNPIVDHKMKEVQQSVQTTESEDNVSGAIQIRKTVVTTIRRDDDDEMESISSSSSEDDGEKQDFSQTLSSPYKYSYWVAANLPLPDDQRVELLKIPTTIGRLRYEYDLLQKCLFLCCIQCGSKICSREDIFSMSVEGPLQNYVNSNGHVHETLTVHRVSGLALVGRSSTQQSWFPGYSWTICECSNCGHHIGWKFMSVKSTRPEYFWGISRASIVPKVN